MYNLGLACDCGPAIYIKKKKYIYSIGLSHEIVFGRKTSCCVRVIFNKSIEQTEKNNFPS